MADFTLYDHGTIWLVKPNTPEAREHLQSNVAPDAQWWGTELVVEHRYIGPLAQALSDTGYQLQVSSPWAYGNRRP